MSKSTLLITTLAAISLVGALGCDNKPKAPKAKTDAPKTDTKKADAKKGDTKADTKAGAKADTKKADAKPAGDMQEVAIDAKTSKIGWYGSKVVAGSHTGDFKTFVGKAYYDKGGKLAKLSFDVDTNSITSDSEKLTGHLKSKDFFAVDKHPKATFVTTAIAAKAKDKFTHEITGDMTILGKKKAVTFPATVKMDGGKLVADTKFSIDRSDFGMGYGSIDENDKSIVDKIKDKAIKKEVVLTIHLEAPGPKK